MQIGQARHAIIQQLAQSDSPAADADCLLCAVLGCSRTWLRTWPERVLTGEQQEQLAALVARRQAGEPIAHLLGEREFWSLPLQVSAATLIPRPDTEVLVEQALARVAGDGRGLRLLDLGTGTGAIALALKSECPALEVWAVERVPEACELARCNATRLALTIELRQGSWFEPVASERFHLIVSNPPYIDALDPHLSEGDVRFEPRSALVADAAGLADLAQIIRLAPDHLLPGGWLLLEHGWQQGGAVRELLQQRGFLSVATVRDYGDQERVSLGQWSSSQEALPV